MSIDALKHDPRPTPLQRNRGLWLGFAVAAPPLVWTVQLLVLTAFANYTCFPADTQIETPVQPWVHPLSVAVDSVALLIALVSAAIAWRYFRLHAEPRDALGRLRMGRLHFVAMGGMLSGTGFFAAILFESIATLMVPPCAG
jgi:hypothetical protein